MPSQQTFVFPDPGPELEAIKTELTSIRSLLEKVVMTPRPEWMSVKDYAKHMSKTPRTIQNWIEEGKVETKMVGGVKMVRLDT